MKPQVRIILIILLIILIVMMVANVTFSQTRDLARNNDLWFTVHGDHQISNKLGVDLELHMRTANWGEEKQQFLVRPSLYYKLNGNLSIYGGYTHIETFPYGEQKIASQTPENNLWLQALLKHKVEKINVSHRYRVESRWTGNVTNNNGEYEVENYTHRNRFRYRLTLSRAIPNSKFSVKLFNEIWVNYGDNVGLNRFDQNWFYAGVGYPITGNLAFGTGYMSQFINKSDGIRQEKNNTIQFTLSYKIQLKNRESNE